LLLIAGGSRGDRMLDRDRVITSEPVVSDEWELELLPQIEARFALLNLMGRSASYKRRAALSRSALLHQRAAKSSWQSLSTSR
jgi:hypothetical protein